MTHVAHQSTETDESATSIELERIEEVGTTQTSSFKTSFAESALAKTEQARIRQAALASMNGVPSPGTGDFNPDDLLIVQKRQDWRVRVARVCLDHLDATDRDKLDDPKKGREELLKLFARYDRIADHIRQDLAELLITAVAVHELEAVRYSINYFLEEIVRMLRAELTRRHPTGRPLDGSSQEEITELIRSSLDKTPDALLVFLDDLVRLAELEIEVTRQRERIRLLLGGDRSLSSLGTNEAIMTAELDELWRALDEFRGVASYLEENLSPLLDKASPYPALEEELHTTNSQLHELIHERIEPFERRAAFKRDEDRALRELGRRLDEARRGVHEILEFRLAPLLHLMEQRKTPSAAALNPLYVVVRQLVDRLEEMPTSITLPEPETPLDGRGERYATGFEKLILRLEDLLTEIPSFRQSAFFGRRQSSEIPERLVLAEMLDELEKGLRKILGKLTDAGTEVLRAREERVKRLRQHFCTLTGELRTFLQTAFAHIAAKDPRSTESSYHFFLREFSDEARQASVLLTEISQLETFIDHLLRFDIKGMPLTPDNLARILRVLFIDKDDEKRRIPSGEGWNRIATFLGRLKDELVPRLQKVCALDGIRYEDKSFLSEWAMDLTRNCTLCLAQHEIGYGLVQDMRRLRQDSDALAAHQSMYHIVTARTCKAMQESLKEICMTLTATVPYVGIMKGGVERRASVFFHRQKELLEESQAQKTAQNTAQSTIQKKAGAAL